MEGRRKKPAIDKSNFQDADTRFYLATRSHLASFIRDGFSLDELLQELASQPEVIGEENLAEVKNLLQNRPFSV